MNKWIKKGEQLLRLFCLARAGYQCEICGNCHELDCHHGLPKSIYPQHRLNPDVIFVLCRRNCHNMAETEPHKFFEKAVEIPELAERVAFCVDNVGVNKHPIDVDYEQQYNELLEIVGD